MVDQRLSYFEIGLLVIRIAMIIGIAYFSTKFVHNKEFKDLGKDHEALYIDFRFRKNTHLNYPSLFNSIFLF